MSAGSVRNGGQRNETNIAGWARGVEGQLSLDESPSRTRLRMYPSPVLAKSQLTVGEVNE